MDDTSAIYAAITLKKLDGFFKKIAKTVKQCDSDILLSENFEDKELATQYLTRMGYVFKGRNCDLTVAACEAEKEESFADVIPEFVSVELTDQW